MWIKAITNKNTGDIISVIRGSRSTVENIPDGCEIHKLSKIQGNNMFYNSDNYAFDKNTKKFKKVSNKDKLAPFKLDKEVGSDIINL